MIKEFLLLLLLSIQIMGSLALTHSQHPEKIRFFLYTNARSARLNDKEEIRLEDFSRRSSRALSNGHVTKILVHGFESDADCSFPKVLKNAYLIRGLGENIITVDWGPLANPNPNLPSLLSGITYPEAVRNGKTVGRQIGKLIEALVTHENIPLSSIHIIGLSLGAHVAGAAGDYIAERFQQRVGRITGLDPAGPLFCSLKSGRLSKSDADFVDVIHTNKGSYGLDRALGHIDFYVNGGGPTQPGCLLGLCSHVAAADYFIQSIGNDKKYGCLCDSYSAFKHGQCGHCETRAVFGDGAQPGSAEGKYYLDMRISSTTAKFKCLRGRTYTTFRW